MLAYIHEKASTSGQTVLSTESIAKDLLETSIKNRDKVYVILDGLDECDREERKKIVTFFKDLWTSLPPNDADSLRCLFTSQDDGIARKDFANMSSLKITEDHIRSDIQTYTTARSLDIQTKLSLPPDRQQYIQRLVTDRAEGIDTRGVSVPSLTQFQACSFLRA